MNEELQYDRSIQNQIAEVLKKDWRFLEARELPDDESEYDFYVPDIYRLLLSGASASEIAEHLRGIDAEFFEKGRGADFLSIAQSLKRISLKK